MRAHRFISNSVLDPNMRPVNVSLDSTTWELAKQKANFSGWVRRKLMEEIKFPVVKREYECSSCKYLFFMGPNSVSGITMVEDCHECGGTSYKTGVTE